MKRYRFQLRAYGEDLASRKPAPGGGSAVSLGFVLGVSLIEKALRYSIADQRMLARYIKQFKRLKAKAYQFIDLDGEVFNQVMRAKGAKRNKWLKKSERIVVELGQGCLSLFAILQGKERLVKKGIFSDYALGLEFVRVVLQGCVGNLKANSKLFGGESRYIKIFEASLHRNKVKAGK